MPFPLSKASHPAFLSRTPRDPRARARARRFPLLALVALALPLAGGCATASQASSAASPAPVAAGEPPPASAPASASSGALSPAEFEALYRERLAAARARHTEADVRFMTDMLHHHGQAVVMARMAPTQADSPQLRTLAARILNSQVDEIRIMRRWLEDRGYPAPVVPGAEAAAASHAQPGDHTGHGAHAARPDPGGHAGHADHRDHAVHPDHADMPGMLTPDQLDALAASRGVAFDRLFLTLMIEHHEGAVTMVRTLFGSDGAAQDPDIFRFASDVQVDQITEIDRMKRMLATLPPDPS